ncbi:hypothetical protein [Nocardia sp. NPDC004260]
MTPPSWMLTIAATTSTGVGTPPRGGISRGANRREASSAGPMTTWYSVPEHACAWGGARYRTPADPLHDPTRRVD